MNVFDVIVEMIPDGATVLDLGCDDCSLLERLHDERHVHGRGVEIDDASIQECIRKGISVFHGNLDEGLKDHPTGSYDYVILSRTMQQVRHPHVLLDEMVRVGRNVIVNFPNFASLINRIQLGLGGRMPVNKNIPYSWYDTPNIHLSTFQDFASLCRDKGVTIVDEAVGSADHEGHWTSRLWPNLFGETAIFRVRRGR